MNSYQLPARRKNRLWQYITSSMSEMVVALWASLSFYIMFATGGKNQFMLFFPLIAGAAALVAMTWRKPVIARVDPVLSFGVFLFVLSILGSYLFNSQRYEPIFIVGNLVSAVLLFIVLYAIATKIDLDLRKTLVIQSVITAALLPAVLATSTVVWGRVTPQGEGMTTNYTSMMALVCFIGACGMRSLFLALPCMAISLYCIVVMESRDSMMSVGIATSLLLGVRLYNIGWKKLRPIAALVFLGGPVVIIALYFVGIDLIGGVVKFVSDLFLLNDEHRGLGSGGSGRTDLWAAAIGLWLSEPVFGVGFKGHQQFMPDHMLAHNAYIGVLAEVGLVGFLGYVLMVGVPFYHLVKRGPSGLTQYGQRVAVMVSYVIYGMLESRAFSFGNTYSLLFLLIAFSTSTFPLKKKTPVIDPTHPKSPTGTNRPASGMLSQSKV